MTEEEYNTVKIASFRITKGLWAEFCDKAESQRLTATDVLKVAIERFLSGELDMSSYKGTPPPQLSQVAPNEDVRSLVDTAVSTVCLPLVARIEAIEHRIDNIHINYIMGQLNGLEGLHTRVEAIEQAMGEDLKKLWDDD